ncbi:MAG: DUF2490 domain-containing protein [Flavobacteriaceae bacterium]|nr:DUF2490 domain-containing protein [Flavobacteriaceae bacterium]
MKQIVAGFIWFFMGYLAIGQSIYEYGAMPSVNLTKKLENNWKINTKLEMRFPLAKGVFKPPSQEQFPYKLYDIVVTGTKKIGVQTSLGFGYGVRWREGLFSQVFAQQIGIKQQIQHLRLAHRIAADQRIQSNRSTVWRFRYRWRTEIPLNGHRLDPKEWYFKLGNEYLNAFNDGAYQLEIRLTPVFGKLLASKSKFELGVQYRLGKLGTGSAKHVFWMQANWYSTW